MVIDAAATQELWEKYFKTRSNYYRNQLIEAYNYLVKKIVHMMIPIYSNYVEVDDLMSDGVMGLISAIERFDSSREVKFETYASVRIRGEIIDCMRKLDYIPAGVRNKVKMIKNAYHQLETQLGRQPTEQEVAEYNNMTVQNMQKILEETYVFNLIYLDEIFSDGDVYDIDSNSPEVSSGMERKELLDALSEFIEGLDEKERLVISMYYFEEMKLKEIALVLEVTESRVSQIHSKTIIKLRNKLKPHVIN